MYFFFRVKDSIKDYIISETTCFMPVAQELYNSKIQQIILVFVKEVLYPLDVV